MRKSLLAGVLGIVTVLSCVPAVAAATVYDFNFSTGGTGTLTYNDATGVANPIVMDFGSFGSITTDFNGTSTAAIFGSPPQEAVNDSSGYGRFFSLRRTGDTANYASVRLYADGTFCVQLLPEPYPTNCVVQGTYRIAVDAPPVDYSGTYTFNFSGVGRGHFVYDGGSGTITSLRYDFGYLGSGSTSFGSSLTALVFGNPPSSAVIQDNTFFALNGGSAYGLRLRANGSFCVRPDAGGCGTGDLVSGTYSIVRVDPGELQSGNNVVAVPTFNDADGNPVENPPPVVLTFDEVTTSGDLQVTLLPPEDPSAPQPPAGFSLAGSAVYYEIQTTSTYTGQVTVCVPYSDVGIDEGALRLFHRPDGGEWEDVTSSGYPDTTNNIICGQVDSFSPVTTMIAKDSDGDGLTDPQELHLNTDPMIPDTDADGLGDGTEVNATLTDPLNQDTDGDGLSDGAEVNQFNTNPLAADTDSDGVPDGVDPTPLTPGVTGGFIESELRRLAAAAVAYPLDVIDAPNNNASKGRRNALANKLMNAANAVAAGQSAFAVDELQSLQQKLDGGSSPPDWMRDGFEKSKLANNIALLIGLIGQSPS